MKVALLRVGIDSGAGGMQGPLFDDGSFEFVPIPGKGSPRTYGNTKGRHGRNLIEYFRTERSRRKNMNRAIHYDPEFESFTYGDPTPPKHGLRRLDRGDLLVFYCGLEPWPKGGEKRLYIIGFFLVKTAGVATDFNCEEIKRLFAANAHVRYKKGFAEQKEDLVLVKGARESRLLQKAYLISSVRKNRLGRPLKVLSPKMREVFGDFHGHISIERSPTRWVSPKYAERAATFVKNLR